MSNEPEWAMQRGAPLLDAAGYSGTSAETLERVYPHHHADKQDEAVRAMKAMR